MYWIILLFSGQIIYYVKRISLDCKIMLTVCCLCTYFSFRTVSKSLIWLVQNEIRIQNEDDYRFEQVPPGIFLSFLILVIVDWCNLTSHLTFWFKNSYRNHFAWIIGHFTLMYALMMYALLLVILYLKILLEIFLFWLSKNASSIKKVQKA